MTELAQLLSRIGLYVAMAIGGLLVIRSFADYIWLTRTGRK